VTARRTVKAEPKSGSSDGEAWTTGPPKGTAPARATSHVSTEDIRQRFFDLRTSSLEIEDNVEVELWKTTSLVCALSI